MKRSAPSLILTLSTLLLPFVSISCQQQQQQVPPVVAPVVEIPVPDAYELWVKARTSYPRTMATYRNYELMKQADSSCPIYICLSQQRGRLYVGDKVAADWPVSTGTSKHPTPTGSFRVLEKKRSYNSRTWGKILDAEGKCVNSNADSRTDTIPEGGKFVGSPMPFWQRLTHSGIGMHIGKVRAGRRLSHGCIRTPSHIARELFKITATRRTRVYVLNAVEDCYPTFVGNAGTTETPGASTNEETPATPEPAPRPVAENA